MDPLEFIIEQQGFMILDGALATELERWGADLDDALWSARLLLQAPDLIRQVHYNYFLAGADVATTASYQASLEGFAHRGLPEEEAALLLRRSVELAEEARKRFWSISAHRQSRYRPLIAASVGPYGAFLADGSEYRGNYGLSVKQLCDWHRPRLKILLEANPDLLAIETIPSLEEAEALLRLLEEFPRARAWMSFSCCDKTHLCGGQPFAEAVALANSSGQVSAIGVNCTPPEFIIPLLHIAQTQSSKYLLAYPNSGDVWDPQRHCWITSGQPLAFGKAAIDWHRAGANLLGGCCRTRPQDIRQIRAALVEYGKTGN